MSKRKKPQIGDEERIKLELQYHEAVEKMAGAPVVGAMKDSFFEDYVGISWTEFKQNVLKPLGYTREMFYNDVNRRTVQGLHVPLSEVIKNIAEIVNDSEASPAERLKAANLLLSIAKQQTSLAEADRKAGQASETGTIPTEEMI